MAESSAHSERTYGNFATVIAMLSWFYLQSLVTLIGAQLNVVLKERLHPRGLIDAPATEADHRAYDAYAKERTYHHNQRVHTEFGQHDLDEKKQGPTVFEVREQNVETVAQSGSR